MRDWDVNVRIDQVEAVCTRRHPKVVVKMSVPHHFPIGRGSGLLVLRKHLAAAKKVALTHAFQMPEQTFPQQKERFRIAIFFGDAGMSDLDTVPQDIERQVADREFDRRIESAGRNRRFYRIQTVRASG